MDLKIRLPESLDQRLRAHAQNTGATMNSIVCLAIDAFVPGGVKLEKSFLEAPAPEPVKSAKPVFVASKQPVQSIPPKPKMSAKPTKQELRKMSEWHRLYGAKQGNSL